MHHYGWSDLRALRSGRFKVIDAPRPELYDIETDPGEQTDIYQQRRTVGDQIIARLRAMEQAFEKGSAAPPPSDVDPEVRARLAALGYVDLSVATANDLRTTRADPKDKFALFNLLGEARDLAPAKGSFPRVTAILRKVLAEDPQVIDAVVVLARQRVLQGTAASGGHRGLQTRPGAEAGLRPGRHQHRRGLSPAGRR